MKVLFHNRSPKLWIGGDAIQVKETMNSLSKQGVECVFTADSKYSFDDFDLVHIFNLNFFWTKDMYPRLIEAKKPYIISAIFFPQVYHVPIEDMRRFVDNSYKTIALSENEKKEMVEMLKCNPDKIIIIPNGIDIDTFFKSGETYDDVVTAIGRLQPMKGPDLLIKACEKLGFRSRYISSECNGIQARNWKVQFNDYYQNISKEKVAELLRKSRVFVCPSLTERQSLSVLEAAACGCPVVDSKFNRGHGLLQSSIVVDPRNTDELVEAIKKQWDAPRNTDVVPTWDEVAQQLLKIYKQIC